MNPKLKIATIALSLAVGLSSPGVVSAVSIPAVREEVREAREDAREEVRENRKNIFEQVREKISSRTGDIKNFLTLGRAAIGSGTITAKTDTTLTVSKDGKTYTVNFDSKTQFRRRFWGKSELSEMSVGDTVNVIGLWTDDTHTAINATLIRDTSIQKRFGVFFGEVKSLLTNGWVMSTKSEKRADQTVTVSSSTKFTNRKGETITRTDVKVGDRVRVRGLWDKAANTVTEVTQVKDFGVPSTPTATPTP